jgi:hypothetical protein
MALPDPYPPADPLSLQIHIPLLSQGGGKLGNLIILCHVGIEILFPLKPGLGGNPAVEGSGHGTAHPHGLNVEGRQYPRIAQTDRAYMGIRFVPKSRGATTEDLGFGEEVNVDLKSDK